MASELTGHVGTFLAGGDTILYMSPRGTSSVRLLTRRRWEEEGSAPGVCTRLVKYKRLHLTRNADLV